jgi:hypothetical protein
MISSQSLTANSKILNVPDGNWRTWLRQTKIKLYTSHGDAGKQIIDETLIPLFPFATRPTKYDQERSINGSPILQFVYARLPSTEARPSDLTDQEYFDSLLDLPLTAAARDELRKDIVTYDRKDELRKDADNKVHALLIETTSAESYTAVEAHANYVAYLQAPEGCRSYTLFQILKAIHATGNSSTKLKRIQDLASTVQGEDTHEVYLSAFNDIASSVLSDLVSETHPGYIHTGTLFSLYYLAGLNRSFFQPILDQLLTNNPSGIFDNLGELQAKIQIWKTTRQISMSDQHAPSTQGQAYISYQHALSTQGQAYISSASLTSDPNPRRISASSYRTAVRSFFDTLENAPDSPQSVAAFTALAELCDVSLP